MQENEWAKYILVAKLYFNYKFYIYTFQSKCLNINLKLFEKYYKYHIFIIQSVILHKPTYSVKYVTYRSNRLCHYCHFNTQITISTYLHWERKVIPRKQNTTYVYTIIKTVTCKDFVEVHLWWLINNIQRKARRMGTLSIRSWRTIFWKK